MDIFGYTVEMLSQLKMETFCCFEKYICKKHIFLFLCTGYLGLEPLGELHCYVHVGETESHVVEAVIVHSPTDLVSNKKR